MTTIIDELKNPSVLANPKGDTKMVMYMYSNAIMYCDCGKELFLSQVFYGNKTYTGNCGCGLHWKLLNGKFTSAPTTNQ